MTLTLPILDDAAVEDARASFIRRQAGHALVRGDAPGTGRPGIAAFLDGERQGGTVVPFGLLALSRRRLRAHSRAHSAVARAASTTDDVARTVGPFRLELIEEPDAAFLVIRTEAGESAPERLDLVNDALGLVLGFDLPAPVDGLVQLMLSLSDATTRSARDALRDPGTEIFLA